mmetsp:Transcript_82279/g.197313  ORF Transcript_82279/g.197313 Transcript_82279/m.197313 type:complete len:288 (-) Transcript_82279:1423-2286(-)
MSAGVFGGRELSLHYAAGVQLRDPSKQHQRELPLPALQGPSPCKSAGALAKAPSWQGGPGPGGAAPGHRLFFGRRLHLPGPPPPTPGPRTRTEARRLREGFRGLHGAREVATGFGAQAAGFPGGARFLAGGRHRSDWRGGGHPGLRHLRGHRGGRSGLGARLSAGLPGHLADPARTRGVRADPCAAAQAAVGRAPIAVGRAAVVPGAGAGAAPARGPSCEGRNAAPRQPRRPAKAAFRTSAAAGPELGRLEPLDSCIKIVAGYVRGGFEHLLGPSQPLLLPYPHTLR